MFVFRKIADYSDGSSRVYRYDPITGQRYLVEPESNESKPWPTLGVAFEGEPPVRDKIGMHYLQDAANEGWVTLVNPRNVHRPGGPPNNPWSTTHTFTNADEVIFHVIVDNNGEWVKKNYRYVVLNQPDKKEVDGKYEVDWCFTLKLESING